MATKLLTVGLGWAFVESCTSNLMPLWFGATTKDFSFEYIQMGLGSNINLVPARLFSCCFAPN